MNNKVKFLRGTSTEYESSTKDNDTFYYTTDDEKLYLGNKEITGGGVTIDDTLSDTSKNPVQNKVINAALNNKAELTDIPTTLPANGGNADTVDGKHASDFVDVNDTETQIEIPSDTNNPIDVPLWITTNGKRYTRYFTATSSGRTNVPNNSETWVWYYFDGNNIIAREFLTDNVWTAAVINNQFTGWKLINSSNADTVNGRHAYRIPTLNENAELFNANAENINDAYLQWDGSSYFKLKTFGKNLTAVDYATNAATVNGLTVQTAVPANAKFTDTTYGAASTSANGLMTTGAQTFAGNKTFNGQVIPAGASDVTIAQARKIYAGTSDMTAGTTALETGAIYLVYE